MKIPTISISKMCFLVVMLLFCNTSCKQDTQEDVANFEKMQQYKQQIEELHTYFTKVITQQADSLSNELIIQGDTCVVFRSTPMAVAKVSSGRLAAASISDLDYLNEAQKNILNPIFLPIIDATSYSELIRIY